MAELHMGVGINTGEVIVGNIGSEKRTKYGAMGTAINMAYRIESHTVSGQGLHQPRDARQDGGFRPGGRNPGLAFQGAG